MSTSDNPVNAPFWRALGFWLDFLSDSWKVVDIAMLTDAQRNLLMNMLLLEWVKSRRTGIWKVEHSPIRVEVRYELSGFCEEHEIYLRDIQPIVPEWKHISPKAAHHPLTSFEIRYSASGEAYSDQLKAMIKSSTPSDKWDEELSGECSLLSFDIRKVIEAARVRMPIYEGRPRVVRPDVAKPTGAAHAAKTSEVADSTGAGRAHPDGPCGIRQWCHGGRKISEQMTAKPHRLACHLFERLGTTVEIGSLIGHGRIWENVQNDAVKQAGKRVSKYFLDNQVPLTVRTNSEEIWMERVGTN